MPFVYDARIKSAEHFFIFQSRIDNGPVNSVNQVGFIQHFA